MMEAVNNPNPLLHFIHSIQSINMVKEAKRIVVTGAAGTLFLP
jgi:hypothetical protein